MWGKPGLDVAVEATSIGSASSPLPPCLCTHAAQVKAQAAAAVQEERARIWEEANASCAQQAKASTRALGSIDVP